ncbi:Spy/CpxP family protein refolding chaperone [Rhodocaloribacter sp.]
MKRLLIFAATFLFLSMNAPVASLAQQPGPHGKSMMMRDEMNQPGTIKGITALEEDAYRSGKGIGMARVAELNHYPGPRHVLDLADELKLTNAQKQTAGRLMSAMKMEATALGAKILEKEKELDALFAAGTTDEAAVRLQIEAIGALKARLRFAHVRTHMTMRAALTPEQIATYDRLRGHADGDQK